MELPSNAFTPSASSFLLVPLSQCLNIYCAASQLIFLMKGLSYLSAVKSMQIALGLLDPRDHSSLPVLKRVQAGICHVRLLRGTVSHIRLPIMAPVLDQMRRALDPLAHPNKVVLWAISCTAFFSFFHLGELLPKTAKSFRPATDLAWGDIAVDNPANPQMVRVHLKSPNVTCSARDRKSS